ncbi:MAG TPA: signal peptidase II [Pyrinomonadaceae bacterium]|nr:signal peptidase II [Pyrinomonadaceae bacterium]
MTARGPSPGWRAAYLVAALGVYVADQVTKAWAVRRLRFGEEVRLVDGLLHFGYAENPGIAFGQLQQGGEFGRWMLSAVAAVAAVGVLVYFFRAKDAAARTLGACALLLAGVAGNLTDRVRLGYVVDFIELHLGSFQWPTFNVADAAICVGAGLLALDIIRDGQREKEEKRRGERVEAEGPTS